jgi:hypothetical protein
VRERTGESESLGNRIELPLIHVLDPLHRQLTRLHLLVRQEILAMLLVKAGDDNLVLVGLDGLLAEVGRVGDEVVDDALTGGGVGRCGRADEQ